MGVVVKKGRGHKFFHTHFTRRRSSTLLYEILDTPLVIINMWSTYCFTFILVCSLPLEKKKKKLVQDLNQVPLVYEVRHLSWSYSDLCGWEHT